MTNLFNGDQVLSDSMNNFLSENWRLFLSQLEKPTYTHFGRVFREVFDSMLMNTPLDELLVL